MIHVIRPGFLTTVQDMGRVGHASEGFPECGACDKFSYMVTNIMAGNRHASAALECTLLGPILSMDQDVILAVSPNAHACVNGTPAQSAFPLLLSTGDTLSLDRIDGARAYIAFLGGLDIAPILGSTSTDMKSRIGGLHGRALAKGDTLNVTLPGDAAALHDIYPLLRANACRARLPRHPMTRKAHGPAVIHLIRGPQADAFTQAGFETLTQSTYTVSRESNRMGIRLLGPQIESVAGTDILSDGILEGSIQIPPSGQPIIMMADHQTTGGYAKIGTVIPTDLPILAQMQEGATLQMIETDAASARARYIETVNQMKELCRAMEYQHV